MLRLTTTKLSRLLLACSLCTARGAHVARLQDLTSGAAIRGVRPDRAVTVNDLQWHGTAAVGRVHRRPDDSVQRQRSRRGPRLYAEA